MSGGEKGEEYNDITVTYMFCTCILMCIFSRNMSKAAVQCLCTWELGCHIFDWPLQLWLQYLLKLANDEVYLHAVLKN